MAFIEFNDVSFTYLDHTTPAIHNLHVQVEQGQWVVICGASGSGKSTLFKLCVPEIMPAGKMTGEIIIDGKRISDYSQRETSSMIGFVMQHPEQHIVMERVVDELVFSMENLGLPLTVMRKRLAEMAQLFDLEPLLEQPTMSLSGGQQQLVQLASILMVQPKILLLDEPLSQLDPIAASSFMQLLAKIHQDYGITVLMTMHRLEEVWSLVDRICLIDQGVIVAQGTKQEIVRHHPQLDLYLPTATQLMIALGTREEVPMTVQGIRQQLASMNWEHIQLTSDEAGESLMTHLNVQSDVQSDVQRVPVLSVSELVFRYQKNSKLICKNLSVQLHQGDLVALFGANGSGKSTLLQLMAGMLKPQYGTVHLQPLANLPSAGRPTGTSIGYIGQQPMLHFLKETVKQELESAMAYAQNHGYSIDFNETIASYGLEKCLLRHPFDLSGGEKQILAIACVLMRQPRILLLDEPTKGLDPMYKERIQSHLLQAHRQGTTIIIATHDIEFAAEVANRCMLMFNGMIIVDATPEIFLRENYFYTTPIQRLVREWVPHAIRWGDVVASCQKNDG